MPTPDKYSFNQPVLWKGIQCRITSRHGQPSSHYAAKWPKQGFYYNLREDKTNKLHCDIFHDDIMPLHIALEHDRERLLMERAD